MRSTSALGVPSARETSTQCPPGPATSSDGMQNSPRIVSARAIANSAPTRTMFIVSRPHPRSTKSSSAGASTSAAVRDVAGLAREDDCRLGLERQQHIGVAVDDLEAGEIRDRALEPGVLAAADERRVEPVALERRTY